MSNKKFHEEMTHKQKILVDHMLYLRKMKADFERQIRETVKNCPHFFEPLTDEQKHELNEDSEDSWDYDDAQCLICDTRFGHRCGSSPDTVCHYYTNSDGQVVLIDGQKIAPPSDHDTNYETDDCCMYCGSPDERK